MHLSLHTMSLFSWCTIWLLMLSHDIIYSYWSSLIKHMICIWPGYCFNFVPWSSIIVTIWTQNLWLSSWGSRRNVWPEISCSTRTAVLSELVSPCVCYPVSGPSDMTELWGGGVPTLVRDCSSLITLPLVITTVILALRPTCLSQFLDHFIPPLLPPPISSGRCRRTSKSHPLSPYFPGTELCPPGRLPHLPPASLCRLLCALFRVPAFSNVSRVRLTPPPFPPLAPGGSPSMGTSAPLCPASLHVCCSAFRLLLGLGSSRCPFHARTRVPGASTPWKSLVLAPAPPATWPHRRRGLPMLVRFTVFPSFARDFIMS